MSSSEERYARQLKTDTLAELAHHSVDQLVERVALAERNWAEFERRYDSEVKRTNSREKRIQAVRVLHTPVESIEDGVVTQRCKQCIGAYDPKADKLIHAYWPCITWATADGRVPGVGDSEE